MLIDTIYLWNDISKEVNIACVHAAVVVGCEGSITNVGPAKQHGSHTGAGACCCKVHLQGTERAGSAAHNNEASDAGTVCSLWRLCCVGP